MSHPNRIPVRRFAERDRILARVAADRRPKVSLVKTRVSLGDGSTPLVARPVTGLPTVHPRRLAS